MLIKNNLHYFIIASLAMGISNLVFTGGFNTPKIYLISTVVFLVIFPVMINTDFTEIFAHFKEPRPIFCSLFLNFAVSPGAAFITGSIFLKDQPVLFTGLILISLIPTSSMSIAWTSFSKGNLSTALYLTPINILFAAFIGLPFIFPLIAGDLVQINKVMILKNIIIVFFIPMICGGLLRILFIRLKGKQWFNSVIKPKTGTTASIGVLFLIFLVMSQKRNELLLDNYKTLIFAVIPVVFYYISIYAASFLWMKFLVKRNAVEKSKAIVMVYTTVARHINISIAIALSSFAVDKAAMIIFILIIAYLIQVPSLGFFAQKFGKKYLADT